MSEPSRRADRRRRPRRLRRIFAIGRLIGVVLVAFAAWTWNWLMTDPRFDLDPAQVMYAGVAWTPPDAVAEAVAAPAAGGTNVFRLSTVPMAARLLSLATVAAADASVVLPNGLSVTVVERQPVFRLRLASGREFAVDGDGRLLVEITAAQAPAAAASLPLVEDGRASSTSLGPGDRLDSIDLGAILTLATLKPVDLGSTAPALRLGIDDEHGFTLEAQPPAWQAIFGFYTVSVRPTSIIGRQVQCLRSLLASGESDVETVYLEPSADRCGTFVPRESPSPTPAAPSE